MFIIDAHEDFAYNALNFGRDYRHSAAEIRQSEDGTRIPEWNGQTLLGLPEYQAGRVALIFGTVFVTHKKYASGEYEKLVYTDFNQARRLYHQQIDYYHRLSDESPDCFRLVCSRGDLDQTLRPWQETSAAASDGKHPVGILMLMEGAEGIQGPEELEDYFQAGLRIVGPVWAGGRLCGGTIEPGGFTSEGRALLERMAEFGYILDISHMNVESSLQALDSYGGALIASHANPAALLKNFPNERHQVDTAITRLVERDGVMGIVPYNKFIRPDWNVGDDRRLVRLEHVVAHIDYVCQLAGDARHVGLGTDFDGGFGWPAVPQEINTIADLPKLAPLLAERGYSEGDIAGIFGLNWQRLLENSLPA